MPRPRRAIVERSILGHQLDAHEPSEDAPGPRMILLIGKNPCEDFMGFKPRKNVAHRDPILSIARSEAFYRKLFMEKASADHLHRMLIKSRFFSEIPLSYNPDKYLRGPRDLFTPNLQIDMVEIDIRNRLHLWELKLLHDADLLTGKVIGQLMMYDWFVRSGNAMAFVTRLRSKGIPERVAKRLERKAKFASWNILVCGGEGWELAAGVNPHMWWYGPEPNGTYLKKSAPRLALWHFYEVPEGWDMRTLWELSILSPRNMHPAAFQKFTAAHPNGLKLRDSVAHVEMEGDEYPMNAGAADWLQANLDSFLPGWIGRD